MAKNLMFWATAPVHSGNRTIAAHMLSSDLYIRKTVHVNGGPSGSEGKDG